MNHVPPRKPPIVAPPIMAFPREDGPPPPLMPPPFIRPPRSTPWQKLKRALVPVAAVLLLLAKFAGKLKFVLLPLVKFFPVLLKTGGSMLLTIWLYALGWGWRFALGFVLLILIHECGHLLAARRLGLKVGMPVFIPFMGSFIALKEAPRHAWIEAQVGIGGPLLGTAGAALCDGVYLVTGVPMFRALAFMGFFLNLFNLAPIGFLDWGRVATALSPWLWLVGLVIVGTLMVTHFNFILFLILVMALPRVLFLFRRKTETERRYFEVTFAQRAIIAALYFGLVAFLVVAMGFTQILPPMSGGTT